TVTDITTAGTWGSHVMLKNEKETIGIHLGPEWFIKDKMKILKGDSITVVGSRIKQDGKDVIIARSVQKNETTLILRDDNGFPKWSGQGKRGR
ncbi:MAG: DNA-binding protein, partial [Spirochaetes bacterium]|nr:DNA-binding protein [Spirochaetota bacterium]